MSITNPVSGVTGSGTAGNTASLGVGTAGAGVAAAASYLTAYITPLETPDVPIKFQFNPEKITLKFSSTWSGWHQSGNSMMPQYGGSTYDDVTVPIILDMFSLPKPSFGIEATIQTLKNLVAPTPESVIAHSPVPSKVMFGWGGKVYIPEAIVMSVSVTYKRFLMGLPIRADVDVRLMAVPDPILGAMNPTSGGLAPARTHVVSTGDTLPSIAYTSYGNPNYWRALAVINEIDDPMRLKVGRSVLIPDKAVAKAIS